MRRVLWSIVVLLAMFIAVGFAVPHFTADRFRDGAQQALQNSLRRRVKMGGVKFNLFTGPGFTISDVVIYDDPKLSPEPILYADKLTAIPRILPLFAGRLAFSSIRLEGAHINLGRTAEPDQPARWNVEPLVRPALFAAFPNISVESGGVTGIPKSRLNFKIGGVKSVFYILIDRLEVRPPYSRTGPWSFRLEGEPARSDRPALGFGSFVADGRWNASQGLADITVRLERSEVSDMVALLKGHDAGIHGSVSGAVRLAGPLSALKINGRIDVSGIHGWDELAVSGQNWPLAIAGKWDLPGQLFELDMRVAGQPNGPVNARFRVADYLGAPHWGASLTCHNLPLQPMLPLARQIGLAIPQGFQLNGNLEGAVSFSRTGPYEGSGRATKVSLAVSGGAPMQFEEIDLKVLNGHALMAPAALHVASSDDATLQGDYDVEQHTLKMTLASRGMDVGAMHGYADTVGMPVVRNLQSGNWRGQIAYIWDTSDDGDSGWAGAFDLQRAVMNVPWLSAPVRIASAHAELDGDSLVARRIQARSGDVAVTGEYRYDAESLRPHQFHFTAARVTGAQLESLLHPAIYRGGLVSRALGLKSSDPPNWLAQTHADGFLDIGTLDLGGLPFERFSTRMLWDGVHVKMSDAKARYGGGAVQARIDADLTGYTPSYHLAGNAAGIPWKGGKVDADLSADTSGTGKDLLANLHSEGSFKAHDLDLDYESMSGCFQFSIARSLPQVKLTSLAISDGSQTLIGRGATSPNGELVLDLEGIDKPVRLTLR